MNSTINLCKALNEHDLTPTQLICLILSAEPKKVKDIADASSSTYANISLILDRMVKRGLIDRAHCTEDRRVVKITRTEAGTKVLQEVLA